MGGAIIHYHYPKQPTASSLIGTLRLPPHCYFDCFPAANTAPRLVLNHILRCDVYIRRRVYRCELMTMVVTRLERV